jgi:hypothetical protein
VLHTVLEEVEQTIVEVEEHAHDVTGLVGTR